MACQPAAAGVTALRLRRWEVAHGSPPVSARGRPARPAARDRTKALEALQVLHRTRPGTTPGASAERGGPGGGSAALPERVGGERAATAPGGCRARRVCEPAVEAISALDVVAGDFAKVTLGSASSPLDVSEALPQLQRGAVVSVDAETLGRRHGALTGAQVEEELRRFGRVLKSLVHDFSVVKNSVWRLEQDRGAPRQQLVEKSDTVSQAALCDVIARLDAQRDMLSGMHGRLDCLDARLGDVEQLGPVSRELVGRVELLDARITAQEVRERSSAASPPGGSAAAAPLEAAGHVADDGGDGAAAGGGAGHGIVGAGGAASAGGDAAGAAGGDAADDAAGGDGAAGGDDAAGGDAEGGEAPPEARQPEDDSAPRAAGARGSAVVRRRSSGWKLGSTTDLPESACSRPETPGLEEVAESPPPSPRPPPRSGHTPSPDASGGRPSTPQGRAPRPPLPRAPSRGSSAGRPLVGRGFSARAVSVASEVDTDSGLQMMTSETPPLTVEASRTDIDDGGWESAGSALRDTPTQVKEFARAVLANGETLAAASVTGDEVLDATASVADSACLIAGGLKMEGDETPNASMSMQDGLIDGGLRDDGASDDNGDFCLAQEDDEGA